MGASDAATSTTTSGGPSSDTVLLSVPLLPFFYAYASYKRHMGGVELRARRFLTCAWDWSMADWVVRSAQPR